MASCSEITSQAFLFIDRLIKSHDDTANSMKKAMAYKEGVSLHQLCGGFIHYCAELEKMMPPAMFKEANEALRNSFLSGFLDPDLQHCLQTQVPPGDLRGISAFRHACVFTVVVVLMPRNENIYDIFLIFKYNLEFQFLFTKYVDSLKILSCTRSLCYVTVHKLLTKIICRHACPSDPRVTGPMLKRSSKHRAEREKNENKRWLAE